MVCFWDLCLFVVFLVVCVRECLLCVLCVCVGVCFVCDVFMYVFGVFFVTCV